MSKSVTIAKTSDVPVGTGTTVKVDGAAVAVFNVDGAYYAIDDACSHVGGPLGQGELDGDTVTCPLHGAQFNVKTGAMSGPPARGDVKTYAVNVDGDDLVIEMD